MPLTAALLTPRDLFEKLKRDAQLLDEEVTSDRFFNFVITGYSIIDWLKHGSSVPESDIDAMRIDKWIKICGDLAIASKHFKLTTRKPITSDATSRRGCGMGRYGKGAYGVGEESIQIELSDGTSIWVLEFVEKIIVAWEGFFSSHAL